MPEPITAPASWIVPFSSMRLNFWTVTFIALIMLGWSSLLFITARDNPTQISRAKKVLAFAVVGLIVAAAAGAIPAIARGLIGV